MKVKPASRLGEVKEYYFSIKLKEIAAMKQRGVDVINLGIGNPDMFPPETAIMALLNSIQGSSNHGYQSYIGIPELRAAFAGWYRQYYGVPLNPETEILPLIGSKEGIMHISMSYLEDGDEVLVPNPGYPAYRAAAKFTGATVREYQLSAEKGWLPDLSELSATNLEKVKIMWVNYPHMPTGATAGKGFFAELVDFARAHRILVCNDNPYSFILNDNPISILSAPGAMEIALELNSLSKSHNMAGWRVGMVAGNAEYIQNILRFKSNMDSGMFKPVQLAAAAALKSAPEWYEKLNKVYENRRRVVFKLMDILNCKYDTSQTGMFVWGKIPDRWKDGYEISDRILAKAHVFITPGGIFGSRGDRYIRISLCSEVAIFEAAIERVEAVLAKSGTWR